MFGASRSAWRDCETPREGEAIAPAAKPVETGANEVSADYRKAVEQRIVTQKVEPGREPEADSWRSYDFEISTRGFGSL